MNSFLLFFVCVDQLRWVIFTQRGRHLNYTRLPFIICPVRLAR